MTNVIYPTPRNWCNMIILLKTLLLYQTLNEEWKRKDDFIEE